MIFSASTSSSSHYNAAAAYMNAENPLSFLENPYIDTDHPPVPSELVGAWGGSNCGLDDPFPVDVKLDMAENGVNVWWFAEDGTGELLPQTGDDYEVVLGWQCIDVGRGYWWGQVPHSDVLWCNLFQVEELDSDDEDTTVLSYTNLAFGGQGVGALSTGACPTDLSSLDPSMKPLQASFTRKILKENMPDMTCNVPAGNKEHVQPSHNSQFPLFETLPDPFNSKPAKPLKRARSAKPILRSAPATEEEETQVTEKSLPVMSLSTCRIETLDEDTNDLDEVNNEVNNEVNDELDEPNLDEEIDVKALSSGSRSNRFAIVVVMTSVLSWLIV